MYGFLLVEPAADPGNFDQEVLLAAHHWEGSWVSLQDMPSNADGPSLRFAPIPGEITRDVSGYAPKCREHDRQGGQRNGK